MTSTRYLTAGTKITCPASIGKVTLSNVKAAILKGELGGKSFLPKIIKIRTTTNAGIVRALKPALPYICGSLFAEKRSATDFQMAHYMIFDIDHVAASKLSILKRKLVELPYVALAFQSPRDGLKAIVSFETAVQSQEDFGLLWDYLAREIEASIGLKVDSAASDCSRACFISYDPEMEENKSLTPLVIKEILPLLQAEKQLAQQQKASSGYLPRSIDPPASYEDDFELARSYVNQFSQMVIAYRDWFRIGAALKSKFGDRGLELWLYFSENPNYEDRDRDLICKWRSFSSGRINFGTFIELGAKYGLHK